MQAEIGVGQETWLPIRQDLALKAAPSVPIRAVDGNIEICRPLEQLGDLWPVLISLREHVPPGRRLVLDYGRSGSPRLGPRHVGSVVAASGMRVVETRRVRGAWQTRVEVRELSTSSLSCTVVVPCRNELGNVAPLVDRLPNLGTHTELIFVDGASTDGTPERVKQLIESHPDRDIKLLLQGEGGGKAAAVRQGFDAAGGDVLIILDADMTVAPEDLPRFYLALAGALTDFANGTRFAYPMEAGAMPGANYLGNRAFSRFLSWLIGSSITDTLCGTKAIFRRDWDAIREARPLFGKHDPWGDFDLLLGAAWNGLHVLDVPVMYRARVVGESKMRPVRHGVALLQTSIAGTRRLKLRGRPGTFRTR